MLNLRSKLRSELLTYYFLNPGMDHYVRELAAVLKVDPTNLSRELKRLESEGLFSSRLRGNQKYFTLNRDYRLFGEVRSFVLKTTGVVPQLRRVLSQVPKVKEAYLYGSFAKKNFDQASDIDVLIVGEPELGVLEASLRRLERFFGREINYTVLTPAELTRRLARSDPFIADVWHGKKVKLVAA